MTILDATATLTSKGQATIPIPVRKALSLGKGDQMLFRIHEGGRIELMRPEVASEHDAVVAAYLTFLEKDLLQHPGKLSVLQRDPELAQLLAGVETEEFAL
jgi:antitoxin PrlF